MKRVAVAVAMLCAAGGAQAQGLSFVGDEALFLGSNGNSGFLPTGTPVNPANSLVNVLVPSVPVGDGSGNRSGYVRLSDILAASGGVSQAQMSASLVGIASRIDRLSDRFSEAVALAGSFNVLPPNVGDRFAVSVGGAGYNGVGAASISASARIGDDALIYGGIARGPTQTMVKGGLGWSFR